MLIQGGTKSKALIFITSPDINQNVQNENFTGTFNGKIAIKRAFNILRIPNVKGLCTLPCEILMSELTWHRKFAD